MRTVTQQPDRLGRAIRTARLLAGLRQADLGGAIGYSASAVSRMESGQIVPDVSTAAAIADALGITLEHLGLAARHRAPWAATVAGNANRESDPVRRRDLLAGVLGVSAVLAALPSPSAQASVAGDDDVLERMLYQPDAATPVALPALREGLAGARQAFRDARYDHLTTVLPGLIGAAEATRAAAVGPQRDTAAAAVARSYVLASELAVKQHRDVAWATADRALAAARASGSPSVVGEAARMLAIAMRRAGRHAAAVDLLEHTAGSLGAGHGVPDPEVLAVYGSLLLTAAYTAAHAGSASSAVALLGEAEDAALRLRGTPRMVVGGDFGAEQCALFRVSVHHALGQDAQAVECAERLRPDRLPTAERRGRFCTDAARAWAAYGKPDRAFGYLRAAEQYAPEEVCRPSLRALTAELLYRPGDVPGLREFARRSGAVAG